MIVMHVGQAKAGSTTIQAFLADNEETLRQHSIDYPSAGRPSDICHRNIAFEIQGLKNFRPDGGNLRLLADYCHQANAETIIVSAEVLESCDTEQALRLAELRRNATESVRVVLILRDLLSLVPSSYAQMVKVGFKTHDFDEFFEKRMQEQRVRYFETARRWADAYGWENLRVRPLDSDHLLNSDLIDDFLSQVDIDVGEPWVRALKRRGDKNSSPGWRVVEAMRALYSGRAALPENHPLADAVQHSREQRRLVGRRGIKIGGKRGWNDDRGRYLTRNPAERCIEINESSIRELNEHLDKKLPLPLALDQRGFRARESKPDASMIPPGELREFYDEIGERFERGFAPRATSRSAGESANMPSAVSLRQRTDSLAPAAS